MVMRRGQSKTRTLKRAGKVVGRSADSVTQRDKALSRLATTNSIRS
jgi:hypothetical protein